MTQLDAIESAPREQLQALQLERLRATVAREGLREYYDPYTGRGMGAREFGWSTLIAEILQPDPRALTSFL